MSDLNLVPDFEVIELAEFKTLISEFENGTEQRRNLWENPKRKFTLQYRNRTFTEYETIRDFYIDKKGPFEAFTYTSHLEGVEYEVRFVDDSIEFTKSAPNAYNFSFDLIEVK